MNNENNIILHQDDNEITRGVGALCRWGSVADAEPVSGDILYYPTKYQPTYRQYI